MASLLDITPLTEEVYGVTVYGVTARGLALLLSRFPEIRALMAGREIDTERLATLAPDALAAIIAAGTGSAGVPEAEERAAALALEMQADFLEAILRLTIPKGIGPFMRRLDSLGLLLEGGAAPSSAAPGTKSPKLSRNSSAADTPEPGTTPPENSPAGSTSSASANGGNGSTP